jgi:hypothetical protein
MLGSRIACGGHDAPVADPKHHRKLLPCRDIAAHAVCSRSTEGDDRVARVDVPVNFKLKAIKGFRDLAEESPDPVVSRLGSR